MRSLWYEHNAFNCRVLYMYVCVCVCLCMQFKHTIDNEARNTSESRSTIAKLAHQQLQQKKYDRAGPYSCSIVISDNMRMFGKSQQEFDHVHMAHKQVIVKAWTFRTITAIAFVFTTY